MKLFLIARQGKEHLVVGADTLEDAMLITEENVIPVDEGDEYEWRTPLFPN